jgi:hypothetical protein
MTILDWDTGTTKMSCLVVDVTKAIFIFIALDLHTGLANCCIGVLVLGAAILVLSVIDTRRASSGGMAQETGVTRSGMFVERTNKASIFQSAISGKLALLFVVLAGNGKKLLWRGDVQRS